MTRTERSVLLESIAHQENINNLPAEELLELGMNYLNQAIKSWETALDSIESAVYMQSRTLALPVSVVTTSPHTIHFLLPVNSFCKQQASI